MAFHLKVYLSQRKHILEKQSKNNSGGATEIHAQGINCQLSIGLKEKENILWAAKY